MVSVHTSFVERSGFSRLWENHFGTVEFDSPNMWHSRRTLLRDAQDVAQ